MAPSRSAQLNMRSATQEQFQQSRRASKNYRRQQQSHGNGSNTKRVSYGANNAENVNPQQQQQQGGSGSSMTKIQVSGKKAAASYHAAPTTISSTSSSSSKQAAAAVANNAAAPRPLSFEQFKQVRRSGANAEEESTKVMSFDEFKQMRRLLSNPSSGGKSSGSNKKQGSKKKKVYGADPTGAYGAAKSNEERMANSLKKSDKRVYHSHGTSTTTAAKSKTPTNTAAAISSKKQSNGVLLSPVPEDKPKEQVHDSVQQQQQQHKTTKVKKPTNNKSSKNNNSHKNQSTMTNVFAAFQDVDAIKASQQLTSSGVHSNSYIHVNRGIPVAMSTLTEDDAYISPKKKMYGSAPLTVAAQATNNNNKQQLSLSHRSKSIIASARHSSIINEANTLLQITATNSIEEQEQRTVRVLPDGMPSTFVVPEDWEEQAGFVIGSGVNTVVAGGCGGDKKKKDSFGSSKTGRSTIATIKDCMPIQEVVNQKCGQEDDDSEEEEEDEVDPREASMYVVCNENELDEDYNDDCRIENDATSPTASYCSYIGEVSVGYDLTPKGQHQVVEVFQKDNEDEEDNDDDSIVYESQHETDQELYPRYNASSPLSVGEILVSPTNDVITHTNHQVDNEQEEDRQFDFVQQDEVYSNFGATPIRERDTHLMNITPFSFRKKSDSNNSSRSEIAYDKLNLPGLVFDVESGEVQVLGQQEESSGGLMGIGSKPKSNNGTKPNDSTRLLLAQAKARLASTSHDGEVEFVQALESTTGEDDSEPSTRELKGRVMILRIKKKITGKGWKNKLKKFFGFKKSSKRRGKGGSMDDELFGQGIQEGDEIVTDVKVLISSPTNYTSGDYSGMPLSPASSVVSIISISSSIVSFNNNNANHVIGATPVRSGIPPPAVFRDIQNDVQQLLYGAINYSNNNDDDRSVLDDATTVDGSVALPPMPENLPMARTFTFDEEDAISYLAEAMKQASDDEEEDSVMLLQVNDNGIDENEGGQDDDHQPANLASLFGVRDFNNGRDSFQIMDAQETRDGTYVLSPTPPAAASAATISDDTCSLSSSVRGSNNIFRSSASQAGESIMLGSVIDSDDDDEAILSIVRDVDAATFGDETIATTTEEVLPYCSKGAHTSAAAPATKNSKTPRSASKKSPKYKRSSFKNKKVGGGSFVKSRVSDIHQRIERESIGSISTCRGRSSLGSSAKLPHRSVPIGIVKTYSHDSFDGSCSLGLRSAEGGSVTVPSSIANPMFTHHRHKHDNEKDEEDASNNSGMMYAFKYTDSL